MEKQKVLICGDVEGCFDALFSRVEKLNEKSGPFDLLLCVGNFFGINNKEFEAYKQGFKKVLVPTYILGPNKQEHVQYYPTDDSELCPNVNYLGKKGMYLNSKGLKIAYLSGIASDNNQSELHTYNVDDVKGLVDVCKRGNPNYKGIDILLTSQWPKNVMKNDPNCKLNLTFTQTTDLISWLSIQLKPRYHISGLEGEFYERPPYRAPILSDHDVSTEIVTRFLGLARVGNKNKQRWLYALSLTPIEYMKYKELAQKTTDETPCPYDLDDLELKLFKSKRKSGNSGQYFYDVDSYNAEEEEGKKHRPHNKRQRVEFDQSKCWFCLASPSVEKHLIITVGEDVYLALAKGGLVEEHLLICPIEHHQSALHLPHNVLSEIEKFKKAIIDFYSTSQNVTIFFERNYKTSHMQIQAVPVPKKLSNVLANSFLNEAEENGFDLEKLDSCNRIDQVLQKGVPYFVVELPDKGEVYYVQIQKSQNFPLNFGRQVLASKQVLNMPNKSDWKECTISEDDEKVLVAKLRKQFESYDFS
ncbi:CWF19-like protein 1 [Agrilus planipennis]|uniref:CWF19-like protein 1 n=1 Tax=Agrilus planipennis TaxID=224129 RepID=A0A1W4X4B3_AGRPL|nr:CWF19-like protein 1 [Agrilus planipennis]